MGLFDSKTQTSPNMPGYLRDFQRSVIKDAKKLYGSDYTHSYTKPTFAEFDERSKMAFDGLTTLAGNNSGSNGMAPHLQGIMSNGGFNDGQREAIDGMKSLASNDGLNELINSKSGLTRSQDKAYQALQGNVYGNNAELQGTFDRGGMTEDQRLVADRYRTGMNEEFGLDPAYLRVKQQSLDAQADALSQRAAAAGRYGGGIDQSILAREQGNLNDRMDVSELDKYRLRTDKAAGDLANISQQGTNTQLGINAAQQAGYQNIAGMGNMGVGQRDQAIGTKSGLLSNIFNSENVGLDRMGQAYQTAQQPMMTQRAVGQEYENQQQKMIDDERRMHAENDPMARMQQYLAMINGMPTGTTSTTSPSWAQILAGGGLGVLGLGSMLGGFGSQPSAAAAGGVAV